jgi:hypothetical protein
MKRLKFFFMIFKDNYRDYLFPLFMAAYLSALSLWFGDFRLYDALYPLIIIITSVMGMADRDTAKSLSRILRLQAEIQVLQVLKDSIKSEEVQQKIEAEKPASEDFKAH